jgi:urea transport system ATP-binding protein
MLNVTNLHTAYGQSEVLHGIDFSVKANETVAIMGRNGMGKTTLFKTLMGVLPLRSGSIEVDGVDVSKLESHRRVARGLAYVPQGRMIFPTLSVEENIQTGLENARDKRIPDEIFALFPVLFDMRRRKGGNLSGGPWSPIPRCCCWTNPPRASSLPSSRTSPAPSTRSARCARSASWSRSRC